jgi:hypothetical protein
MIIPKECDEHPFTILIGGGIFIITIGLMIAIVNYGFFEKLFLDAISMILIGLALTIVGTILQIKEKSIFVDKKKNRRRE